MARLRLRARWDAAASSLEFVAALPARALAWPMTSYSEPSPEQETVGGGAESIPQPEDPRTDDPRELGGDDSVAANDALSSEEVKR
jgi:hypothetical protein